MKAAFGRALGRRDGRGSLPNLEQLYLSENNKIGDSPMKEFAKVFSQLPRLVHLELWGNSIGDVAREVPHYHSVSRPPGVEGV